MDEDETIIPNIEDIGEVVTPNPDNNDCRINCTDNQSLRSILDITLNQLSQLADSCNLKDEDRSEFISSFGDSFKNALQENIVVNELPLIIDKSNQLSSHEKEDHLHMVDDVLYSRLSKTVANVAHKRKFYPEQCCRILNIQMKHELQNLKKVKVTSSVIPSASSVDSSNHDKSHIKKFSNFCKDFSTMKEIVQCKLQEKKKVTMKLSVAKDIRNRKRTFLRPDKDSVDTGLA